MKKIVSVMIVVVMAFAAFAMTGCTKRSEELYIFSQGEYLEEQELFEKFEAWYTKKTGEKIKVKPVENFDSNEDMFGRYKSGALVYDLICPSDYMVEKMIAHNMVQPLDTQIFTAYEDKLFRDEFVAMTREFDPQLSYSVPYMFGTLGLMYNYEKTEQKHLNSLSALFTDAYKGEITLKLSVRDTYIASALWANRDALSEMDNTSPAYKTKIQSIFNDTSDTLLNQVATLLESQRKNLKKFDNEDGKYIMSRNEATAGLFWSCDAGYVMNDFEDEDTGNTASGNKNLWYVIPEEGGNVYLDSFVIPTNAVNVKGANHFLQFLCTEEAALINSRFVGAVSTVKSAYDILQAEMAADDDFFAGTTAGWKEMYMEMMFPSAETLNRCGQMRDYKDAEEKILTRMSSILVA